MIAAIVIGVAAGVVAGMLGVGGGVLFVPALVIFRDLSHVDAEATSLLAIVPVAIVGTWQQTRYGNVRLRDGIILGTLAIPGAVGGVALVNVLPERVVKVAFAGLMLFVAARLVRRALADGRPHQEA